MGVGQEEEGFARWSDIFDHFKNCIETMLVGLGTINENNTEKLAREKTSHH